MADVKWIKIVTDVFDDEKVLLIESLPEADSIIVIWFKLLCLAGKQNNSGVFLMNDKIPYTDKMLATIFRRKESTVQLALQTFKDFGMIEIVDGVITIPNWEKHQKLDQLEMAKEQTRQRVARHRAKQKLLASGEEENNNVIECNVTGNVTVTSSVTQCNGDRIDKNRIDKNRIEDNINNMSSAKAQDEAVIDLPTNRFNTIQECYYVTKEFYKTMSELYPNVNVLEELKKMKAWLISNSSKRKTIRGMEKFINSWLSRKQDSSSNNSKPSGIDWNEWDKKNNSGNNYTEEDLNKLIESGEVF